MDIATLYAGVENVTWFVAIMLKISEIAFHILNDTYLYIGLFIVTFLAYFLGNMIGWGKWAGEFIHGIIAVLASSLVIAQGWLTLKTEVTAYLLMTTIGWIPLGGQIAAGAIWLIEKVSSFATEWVYDLQTTYYILLLYLPLIAIGTFFGSPWLQTMFIGTLGSWFNNILKPIPLLGSLVSFIPLYPVAWVYSYFSGSGCLYPRPNHIYNFADRHSINWLKWFSLRTQRFFTWHPHWQFKLMWRLERKKRWLLLKLKRWRAR